MGTIKNKPSIRTKYKDLQFTVGPFLYLYEQSFMGEIFGGNWNHPYALGAAVSPEKNYIIYFCQRG